MFQLRSDDEGFSIETRDASPAHLLVKIESFSLLSENGIREYESREFFAGDHKWRLIIYPDGDKHGKKGDHVSASLSMVETKSLPVDWEVNAMFNIFLFNQIQDNYLCFRGMRRFHAMNPKWGFSKLICKKRLMNPSSGYLVGDKCVFGAEVFVIKSQQRLIDSVSVRKVTTPYKHDLVISQFSKLKGGWHSEELTAEDYRWKIVVHPKGSGSAEDRFVSIFVTCVDSASFAPHEKVKANICIRFKNKKNHKHWARNVSQCWFSSTSPAWGYADFISIGDLCDPAKGYIVDDRCFLEIEISVKAVVRDID